jgi:hypothetical protein
MQFWGKHEILRSLVVFKQWRPKANRVTSLFGQVVVKGKHCPAWTSPRCFLGRVHGRPAAEVGRNPNASDLQNRTVPELLNPSAKKKHMMLLAFCIRKVIRQELGRHAAAFSFQSICRLQHVMH